MVTKIKVFNKMICFSEEEVKMFSDLGLTIDILTSDFIEIAVNSANDTIVNFSEDISDEEAKEICVKSIAKYTEGAIKSLEAFKKQEV